MAPLQSLTSKEQRTRGDIHTSTVQHSFRHMQVCGRNVRTHDTRTYSQTHSELQTGGEFIV